MPLKSVVLLDPSTKLESRDSRIPDACDLDALPLRAPALADDEQKYQHNLTNPNLPASENEVSTHPITTRL